MVLAVVLFAIAKSGFYAEGGHFRAWEMRDRAQCEEARPIVAEWMRRRGEVVIRIMCDGE